MLCTVCKGCGLCEGEGAAVKRNGLRIEQTSSDIPASDKYAGGEAGIAVDIGTTTVAASVYSLRDGRFLFSCGEENILSPYGADIITRIKASLEGNRILFSKQLQGQVQKLALSLYARAASLFLSDRAGRISIRKIVITGNTAMLSFFCGLDVKGLSACPFKAPGLFGFESDASVYFSAPELKDASVYFPPAVSAFCGPDLVSSIISALDFSEPSFIADAGTNCEMAFYDSEKKCLTCTSSAAGPAFEARGISSGMTACEGAVEDVSLNMDGSFTLSVIGGSLPKGFCGSGLLSAVAFLYEKTVIDENGTFVHPDESYFEFADGLTLTQEDIRNFQLAKSAVASGLSLLYSECGLSEKYPLYLCGGFGRRMNEASAEKTGLVPPFTSMVISLGNTALKGAALFLSDEGLRKKSGELSKSARVLELPDLPPFSEVFIKNINFPPLK